MVVEEPEAAWLEFYVIITSLLDNFYPFRSVTITSRDPGYMTPEIKNLLRRRNILMRRQKTEEAAALSLRIGREIARFNSRELRSLDSAGGTKKVMGGCQKNRWWGGKKGRTPHQCRGSQLLLRCHLNGPQVPAADQEADCSSGRSIIGRVSYLWNTRPSTSYGCGSGSDPSLWYLRVLAPACSGWLARLYSLSLCCSWVPTQWKNAVIYPVPKT